MPRRNHSLCLIISSSWVLFPFFCIICFFLNCSLHYSYHPQGRFVSISDRSKWHKKLNCILHYITKFMPYATRVWSDRRFKLSFSPFYASIMSSIDLPARQVQVQVQVDEYIAFKKHLPLSRRGGVARNEMPIYNLKRFGAALSQKRN